MAEYYPPATLAESRRLYDTLRTWAAARDDVTIIGGWPVYELVAQDYKMQSRDTDLVFHTRTALEQFLGKLPEWGLALRTNGRRVFPDCTFRGHKDIVVDILIEGSFDVTDIFGRSPVVTKAVPRTLIPPLPWMIADKVATIPHRVRDAVDKRTKDFLDLYGLVFHNREHAHPRDLLPTASKAARTTAVGFMVDSRAWQPKYGDELDAIEAWLRS